MVLKQLVGKEFQNEYDSIHIQVKNLLFEVKSELCVVQVCKQIWYWLGFKLVI